MSTDMSTDKEIREKQNAILFDLIELNCAKTEDELRRILKRQMSRTKATMSKEDIAAVEKEAQSVFG